MKKDPKNERITIRVTAEMKKAFIKRAGELNKNNLSEYLEYLFMNDIDKKNDDKSNNELNYYANKIIKELSENILNHFNAAYLKNKEREEKILAQLFYNHRYSLYYFYNLAIRLKTGLKLAGDEIKNIDEETKKIINKIFEKQFDYISNLNANELIEILKNEI